MSVEVTRLPSGLAVVTDAMPHLESASLGVWVGAGSRDERADEHGISHLLEHMAFKGTTRRTARQIAEEIEAVGGDLNAATSVETTAYYARVLKADVPLALDVLSDILANPTFDPDELAREQNVIVQEIGAAEDTPDDLVFDHLQRNRFPGPADRPLDPRHARDGALVRSPQAARTIWRAIIAAPDMVVAAAGAVDHAAIVERGRSSASPASPGRRRRRRSRRVSAAARMSRGAISSRCISRSRFEGLPQRDPSLYSLQVLPACWVAGCRRGCSRKCVRSAGSAIRSTPSTWPMPTPACSAIYAGTDAPTRRN